MSFVLDAVLAAGLAGVSAGLWVDGGAPRLVRTSEVAGPSAPGPVGRRFSRLAARADASPLRRRIAMASIAALAIGVALQGAGAGFEVLGWLAVPPLTVAGVVVLGRLEPSAARRRRERLVMDLPQGLELLSACLAAGMPLRQATRAVADAFSGPVGDDLAEVLVQVDLGLSDAEAWRLLRSHPQWGAAAVDLARSVESGTMMVEVLKHHARSARELRRAALEVRAKAVGVRSVLPLMTCFLPAFLLLGVVPTVASAVSHALF